MNTKIKLGRGVFTWASSERQSRRYGSFYLGNTVYSGNKSQVDFESLEGFVGRRVRISVVVIETRNSEHVGDQFLEIFPSTPSVGATFELGVGTLFSESIQWEPDNKCISIKPDDNRDKFWLDPHILYQLHEQTVDIYIEETDAPNHKAPNVTSKRAPGAIANGDGTFQVYGAMPKALRPKICSLGGGTFVFESPVKGERLEVVEYEDEN